MEDLAGFDEMLSDKVHKQPTENLQIFEEAAREVADEITSPRPEGEEEVQDIQILLQSNANPTNIRDLKVSIKKKFDLVFIQQFLFFLSYLSRNVYHDWSKWLVSSLLLLVSRQRPLRCRFSVDHVMKSFRISK